MAAHDTYLRKSPSATRYGGGVDAYVANTMPKPPVVPTPVQRYGPATRYPSPNYRVPATPDYGAPPTYKPNMDFGPVQRYNFDPYVDTTAQNQSNTMIGMAQRAAAEESRQREAELFQIRSQWRAPRQSRMTMLGGY